MWQALLIGPILIAAGIWEYERLAELDAYGGTIYVDKLTAFLYAIGGKTTVLVMTSGVGVFYMALLWHWYRTTRAAEARLAELEAEPAPPPPPARRPLRDRGERPAARPAPGPAEGGPFRSPPTSTIRVIRTDRPAARPAIVPGTTDDPGPSILR